MVHRAPSSSVTYKWTYDVFLSFYGDDTRLGFTSHLHQALRQRGIRVFLDDECIRTGENITPSLFRAIEESRIAIIVFSGNYANSTFCLRELAKILECFKEESRLIYPVFYHVDPSELRNPRESYAEALARLEERFKDERHKVKKWRLALSQAADLKGCHLKPRIANEQECITRITNEVATRMNQEPLDVTDYPVGLVPRVKEVISYLDLWSIEKIKMIGIWGAGGIGKSTIARALYNSIADNFEGLCFLSNVRKRSKEPNGLSLLQETLLSKLVMAKDLNFGDYHEGIPIIQRRLSQKKILLILDDVDESDQLKALAGSCNWFACGSRIIITTKDKQLLISHGIESIYDVTRLNSEESLKLLSWYAFKKENVDSNYVEVCNRAVDYSCGFPLALEVIGSNLRGKGVNHWSSALAQFKRRPQRTILDALKLSYDMLDEEPQRVFLDLACFFNGEKLAKIIDILRCVRAIEPTYAIDTLIDKSLIKIELARVTMHDLIEDVGKEIVRQYSPGEQSRLWFYQDILQVLQEGIGTDKVEAIILDLPESIEVQWSGEELMKMKNLKMLVIRNACFSGSPKYLPNSLRWLEWKGYSFKFFPVCPAQLVYLDLSYSSCEFLQPSDKKFPNLSLVNLRNCKFLQQIPDLSGAFNLTELWLDGCTNLAEIHDSIGCLNKLRELSAMRCKNLKIFPSRLRLTSLEHLNLFGCSSLQTFPEIPIVMKEMQTLDLDKTAITELPSSICNLIGLESLSMEKCPNLKQLPASICTLPNLRKLTTDSSGGLSHFKMREGGDEGCSAMSLKMEQLCFSNCNLSDDSDSLAFCLSHFTYVIHLDLSFNNFTILPECIKECHNLQELLLDHCIQLEHIGGMPPNLVKFSAICCTSLTESSKRKVFKQVSNIQPGKRNFILPGKELPEGLYYYDQGSSVSFWVCNVFAMASLWILFKHHRHHVDNYKFSVYINGDSKVNIISSTWVLLSRIMTDHIYMCDMQSIIPSTKLPLVNKWNQVKISFESEAKEIYFGVHVYNPQSNGENIQFSKRRIVALHMHNQERDIMEKLRPYRDLEILKMYGHSYNNLIELHQINCKNCCRVPALGQLPALRTLTIEGFESVVAIGSEFFHGDDSASLVPFPSLETLHFENMISWEEWNSIDMDAFPKLHTLRFHDCPKLIGNLPRRLRSLRNLEIERCPLLASSIPNSPYCRELVIIKSPNVVLQEQELPPSLSRLTISERDIMEKLRPYWYLQILKVYGHFYNNLIGLHQINCKNCWRIPALGQLPALRTLTIEGLESVAAIGFEFFHGDDSASLVPFPSLETLHFENMISWEEWNSIDMDSFPNLRTLRFHDCPKLTGNLPRQLRSLRNLEIERCPLLSSSIPNSPYCRELVIITSPNVVLQEQDLPRCIRRLTISVPLYMPHSMEQLAITDCANLKFGLVSKAPLRLLRRISIHKCKFLRYLFDDMKCLLPNLEELFIEGCPELEPSSITLPLSLKRLEIRECDKLLSCLTVLHNLPTITQLCIYFRYVTRCCKALRHLTSRKLQILDSPNIEKIGETMPSSLRRLHVCHYGFLLEQCPNNDENFWLKILNRPFTDLRYLEIDTFLEEDATIQGLLSSIQNMVGHGTTNNKLRRLN